MKKKHDTFIFDEGEKIFFSTFFSVIDIPMERSSAFGGRMLPNPLGDGAYFIHRSDIWEIVCNRNACEWVEKTQKLEIEREGLVAMYIPEEMAICN